MGIGYGNPASGGGGGAESADLEQGGADEIDGDKIAIDLTPDNYTPATDPGEVDDEDQLSAHLAGIDDALASIGAAHAPSHLDAGADTLALTDAEIAAANKDGVAGTASMRTLGTGAQQACAGNDGRLSDARTPSAHDLGGSEHGADTLANLNAKISDATLDDDDDPRPADEIITTTGPTTMAVGAVADGEYLKRSGSTVVGGTPAGGGGGAWSYVKSVEVTGSAAEEIDITGLDGDADERYLLLFDFFWGDNPNATNYHCYPNGTVISSGGRERLWSSNATNASAEGADWIFAFNYSRVMGHMEIAASAGGRRLWHSFVSLPSANNVDTVVNHYAGFWGDTSTNITSLTLHADDASGFAVGSKVHIYKIYTGA